MWRESTPKMDLDFIMKIGNIFYYNWKTIDNNGICY